MIITFCGHASFQKTQDDEERVLRYLGKIVGGNSVEMYLGGYGAFDAFAYSCCKKYQSIHKKAKLVFVSPYLPNNEQGDYWMYQKARYDEVLYPEIEEKPIKFAITYRNRYMVDQADCVIAYVEHDWGGAYQTYQYAKRKNKPIFNLAHFEK